MSELSKEPAQTYQLNVLCSALGRFASPHLNETSIAQANLLLEETVDTILDDNKPVVPHTNDILIEEAIRFDQKLIKQIKNIELGATARKNLVQEALFIVSKHRQACEAMQQGGISQTMLINPDDIAQSYGLPDLWLKGHTLLREEARNWAPYTKHPDTPNDLTRKVSKDETEQLMRLMWKRVIGLDSYPEVETYLTDSPDYYHVFWAPLSDTLDYATPSFYDRATQLSFDLPHNATHLAHLNAMQSHDGVLRYNDNMQQRAFFEAATVFSEYKTIDVVQHSPDFSDELFDILRPNAMNKDQLSQWVIEDRGYEFKLRAARYAADILMLEGASFIETKYEVSKLLDIPEDHADKETRKYLAWTGLGAVYTFGYRKLIDKGFTSVKDVISPDGNHAALSWTDIDQGGQGDALA